MRRCAAAATAAATTMKTKAIPHRHIPSDTKKKPHYQHKLMFATIQLASLDDIGLPFNHLKMLTIVLLSHFVCGKWTYE